MTDRTGAVVLEHAGSEIRWLRFVTSGVILLFLSSTYFSIAVTSISLGLLALLWLGMMAAERHLLVNATPLDYFFLAYVIAELLSTAFSYRPGESLYISRRLLLIGIVYMFVALVTAEQMLRRCVAVLLGTATVVATIGAAKVLFGNPAEGTRLGIFQFYMTTSGLMMIAGLMVLPFAVHPATPRGVRISSIVALAPILFSLYATVTRGAYLAAAAGMLFIAFTRNRKLLIPFILLIIMLVVFAPPYVEQRIQSIFDLNHPENATRLMMWKTGLRMFMDQPLIGVGDIDLHDLYVQYADPGDPAESGHLHNVALQFLVTLGGIGFVVVAAMFVRIFQIEWRIHREVREQWFAGSVTLGAMAVFVGFHVHGLTEWTFGDQEVVTLFWVALGFALAAGRQEGARHAFRPPLSPREE